MSETKARMLSVIAQKTGLARETVKDLMRKGWVFTQQPDTGRSYFHSPAPKGRVR